jgi:peptidoglycan/LPS O-acetylase OafA/YrhL
MDKQMKKNSSEIRPLTGIRGIAALTVVLYHYFANDKIPGQPYFFLMKGYLSVDLFFMLSGIVLAMNYSNSVTLHGTFRTYRIFILKRLARIYPLYITATVFLLMIAAVRYYMKGVPFTPEQSLPSVIANIFLVQTWGFGESVVGPAWSISVEFAAYILFPILVALTITSRAIVASMFAAVLIALLVFAMPHAFPFAGMDLWEGDTVFPLLRCIAGFSFGLIAFRLSRNLALQRIFASNYFFLIAILACSLCVAFNENDLAIYATIFMLIISCHSACRIAEITFGNPVAHYLGQISYSIYLGHVVLWSYLTRLSAFSDHYLARTGALGKYLLPVVILVVIGTVLHFVVERGGKKVFFALCNLNDRVRLTDPSQTMV